MTVVFEAFLPKMSNVKSFYGRKKTLLSVSKLQDAIEIVEESNANTITILPPDTGDLDIPSDEEIDISNVNEVQETAGELEVEISEDEIENVEPMVVSAVYKCLEHFRCCCLETAYIVT